MAITGATLFETNIFNQDRETEEFFGGSNEHRLNATTLLYTTSDITYTDTSLHVVDNLTYTFPDLSSLYYIKGVLVYDGGSSISVKIDLPTGSTANVFVTYKSSTSSEMETTKLTNGVEKDLKIDASGSAIMSFSGIMVTGETGGEFNISTGAESVIDVTLLAPSFIEISKIGGLF